jgi:N,N-dimethylformamidase
VVEDMSIIGYASAFSLQSGDRAQVMVSTGSAEYDVQLERLSRVGGQGDPVEASCNGRRPGREQRLPMGSYVRFEARVPRPEGWELSTWLWPTAPGGRDQALLCWGEGEGLFLTADGVLAVRAGGVELTAEEPVERRTWAHVRGGYDPETGQVHLVVRENDPTRPTRTFGMAAPDGGRSSSAFSVAAALREDGVATAHYDGKLEAPELRDRNGVVVAAWDFSERPGSVTVTDRGPGRHTGTTVNQPSRAMTGHNWDGTYVDHRVVPHQYGAIAFHSDDLSDAGWEPDFEVDTTGLPSGIYAVRLRTADGEDAVPLFVTPAAGSPRAAVAVLLPTFTYIAYGNERHWWNHTWVADVGSHGTAVPEAAGPADRYAGRTGMVSLYDHHTDGSGNSSASRMRPLVNIRGDYQHPAIGGPHLLSADLHLIQWLEEGGISYDVLTDEELHHGGLDAVRPYRAVLTGHHPEYHSEQMLDALTQYTHGGGNLMYLGGNGFYWVTSVHPEEPHVIEVRRGVNGTRPWQSEPGEFNHASTGELGGLWRNRGRAPNRLVGVGTAGFVFSEGRPFSRTADSKSADVEWVFDGVQRPEAIGDSGAIMGGAASFEFDRYDRSLGSPRETVVLATAADLGEVGEGNLEELIGVGRLGPIQADMVYIRRPHGGAVFSTGSCGWITSLLENGRDNDVSRLTANVLRRFTS